MFANTRPAGSGPPADFQLARDVDLASQAFAHEPVLAFTLAEPAVVGIYYALQNVDTGDFDLSLESADGQRIVPMGANRLRTDRNGGGLWEEALPAGTYRLLLSAAQSQGTLSVYWSDPE